MSQEDFYIYIEVDEDTHPSRRVTRRAARRARRRIQHALRAQEELEEAIVLADMEQQAREYAMAQRMREEEERRREEELKEEAVAWSGKMIDLMEEEQFYKVGLNLAPKDRECGICLDHYDFEDCDGASVCGKSNHWICYTCYKNMVMEAYIKASANTFTVPCPFCRQEHLFNKNVFN